MIYIIYLILFAAMLAADLISKYIVAANFTVGQTLPVIRGVFHITYVINNGAAFSLFAGKQMFLIILTAAVILAAVVYIAAKRPKNPLVLLSLTMILAGGCGNLFDRITLNGVRDFFDFRIINFAVFNTADIFVVCGAVLLAVYLLFFDEKNGVNAN